MHRSPLSRTILAAFTLGTFCNPAGPHVENEQAFEGVGRLDGKKGG